MARPRSQRLIDRDDAVPRPVPDMGKLWPGGGGGLPGQEGGGGAPRMASYALQPPTYFQPPGAPTLRLQGRNAGQALGDGEVTLAVFNLQGGNLGVLRTVTIGVIGLLLTSDIFFRIRVGGAVVPGWTIQPFAVPAAVFLQEFAPESTLIELPEGVRVALTAQVIDAGTYTLDMMAQGWQYGRALRDDYDRAWRAGAR